MLDVSWSCGGLDSWGSLGRLGWFNVFYLDTSTTRVVDMKCQVRYEATIAILIIMRRTVVVELLGGEGRVQNMRDFRFVSRFDRS